VLAVVCLYPVLDAGFVLVDDHEILTFSAAAREQPEVRFAPEVASVVAREAQTIGRFRPAYWAVRLAEVRVLGENPRAWHALVVLMAVSSALMLFWVARRLGVGSLPALLPGALLLVGPGVSSLWVRLGPPETIATVFLLISLYAAVAACRSAVWDAVFVLASVLAMLSKEPFALAGLALAAFRIAQQNASWRSRRALAASAVVLVASFVVLIADYRISASAGTSTYGGRYLAGTSLLSYPVTLAHNGLIVLYASCAWVLALAVRSRMNVRAWLFVTLATAVVLPQLALYSLQGVMEGRYEVPCTIAVTLLAAFCVKWLNPLALAALALNVGMFGFSTWTYAAAFAADSRQLNSMLTTVAEHAPGGSVLALVVDPGRRYEPALAVLDELASRSRPDLAVHLVAVNQEGPYTADEAALAQNLASQLPPLQSSDCAALGAVILLADAPAESALPCPRSNLREMAFTEDVLLWGGETVSFRPRVPGVVAEGYRAYIP
jgi:hypothetical protein